MSTQFVPQPSQSCLSFSYSDQIDSDEIRASGLRLGPNDSSINRGDREDTGDNEAQPDEMGSGPAHPTFNPTSFDGIGSTHNPADNSAAIEQELLDDEGFEIEDASDGRLGLTNIGDRPAEDWAADTGPSAGPESET